MAEIDKDVGALEADVRNLAARIDKMETQLGEIHVIVTKAKGGWLLLIMIGGGLTWFLQTIVPMLKKVSF
jgi:chromosome condensin MukBEF ATPase and DNA-binding subunit MukB